MIEKPAIAILLRSGPGEATVLCSTFLLTVFRDLTDGILVGCAIGSVLFIQRMGRATESASRASFVSRDKADTARHRETYDEDAVSNPEAIVYRITGALFFGAAASIGSLIDRIPDGHKALIVDFSGVPFLDSTGASMIEGLAHKMHRQNTSLWLTGTSRDIRRALLTHRLKKPLVNYAKTVDDAMKALASEKMNSVEP